LIWVVIALIAVIGYTEKRLASFFVICLGYLLIMAPWYLRNWFEIGQIFPKGSSSVLWMTEYNDLYVFDSTQLSFTNWYKQGIVQITRNIVSALGSNLKTLLFVQGEIVLFPFIVLGIKDSWHDIGVRIMLIAWLSVFVVMSVIFPFAGARGGFFHSGATFQPAFWTLAAIGFRNVIRWGAAHREWNNSQAHKVLTTGLIVIIVGMNSFIYFERVIGMDLTKPRWNSSYKDAIEIDKTLNELGISKDDVVFINNPPGLYIASQRSSFVIPNGDIETLIKAAEILNVGFLVLESNHPSSLAGLYFEPEKQELLDHLKSDSGVQYFKILTIGE
jgi:hypothetical protein